MTSCSPLHPEKFKPFGISTWKRYHINEKSDLYQSLVKTLELPEDNEYEIFIQVRGIKYPVSFR